MSKAAVFTMKLEPELRADFMAAAAGEDRPASQVMRELMRSYIEQHRRSQAYDEFLETKVVAARAAMHFGEGRANEAVEAAFAARREQARKSRP